VLNVIEHIDFCLASKSLHFALRFGL
jgi:hypothetical protein